MTRIVRSAGFVADLRNILRISEENWGRGGRERHALLIERGVTDLARDPRRPGASAVPDRPGAFGYHLRHSRYAMPRDRRVGQPRHVVYFRLDADREVIRLLRLLHDRMLPDPWLPPDDAT